MDNGWAVVAAALGSSALTTCGLLLRDGLKGRKARSIEPFEAYREVLTRSMMVVSLATGLRMTLKIRSGIKEGIDITLRHRKPLEPFDVSDRFGHVLEPLVSAQTAVWVMGSQRAIELTNTILDRCLALLSASTAAGQGSIWWRNIVGEKWGQDREAAFAEASRELGNARQALVDLLRSEEGKEPVNVFARTEGPG